MSPLCYALLEICREENSSVTVEGIRNKALEKLLNGEVKSLVTTSVNGKSRSYTVSKPADVLLQDASMAIRLFNKGVITTTTFDSQWI